MIDPKRKKIWIMTNHLHPQIATGNHHSETKVTRRKIKTATSQNGKTVGYAA